MSQRELADWWTRAGGFVLDQLIVSAIVLGVVLLVAVTGGDTDAGAIRTTVYIAAIPVGCLYAPLLMARGGTRNGQTIGKQIVGIRVVRMSGEPMTFWAGVLRTVVAQQLLIAITFYVYAVVDYLWPLRDPQNQALHDKLAKTWVLRADAPAPAPPPADPPAPPVEAAVRGEWLPPQAPGG